MKLDELVELLDCTIFTEDLYDGNREFRYAFSCDLMSDVLMCLRHSDDSRNSEGMLVTGLVTNQAIRTAEILDLGIILFVRDKLPSRQVIELAHESDVILLGTKNVMYTTSGILFEKGIESI